MGTNSLIGFGDIQTANWCGNHHSSSLFYFQRTSDRSQMLEAVRSHWGIENSLHWILDVVFDEDHNRVRKDNVL